MTTPRLFYFPPPQVSDSGSLEERTRTLAEALAKQSDLDALDAQLNVNAQAIAELQSVAAASRVTAAYVADIQDMATAPRGSLVGYNGTSTGGANDGPHSHSISPICPTYKPHRELFVNGSQVVYTPIIVDRNGLAKKMRWIVGSDTSIFQIDSYNMALCVYNPANGNIEKVWDSGNLKDSLTNTTYLQEVEVDMQLSAAQGTVTPGQVLFVAHQQIAPGLLQGTRSFAAVPQSGVARPSTLLLNASCFRTTGSLSGIPSSIAKSSLQPINFFIPWAAVSVTQGAAA